MGIGAGIKKAYFGVHQGIITGACKLAQACGYDKLLDDYMVSMMKCYESNTECYASYRLRPKRVEDMALAEEENEIDAQVGIVMQGPLFVGDHFELETVRIYRRLFPSAKIIISTWEGENENEIKLLRAEPNCCVIQSTLPPEPGILHRNYQCASALAGIKKAKELGCKYAAKTRGDIRIYEKGALRFMVHLIDNFPCRGNEFKQNKRLIAYDVATPETSLLYYPYWITDIFMFGDIDDMEFYWNSDPVGRSDMQKKQVDKLIRTKNYTWKKRALEKLHNEIYIAMNYLQRRTGKSPEYTVKKYWEILDNYFIIISKSLLDIYFYKHEYWRYNEALDYGTYFRGDSQEELATYNFNLVSWFNLYNHDMPYHEKYERMYERTYKYKKQN